MYGEFTHAIAARFHAEHLSTIGPDEDGKSGDEWTLVFRLFLSRIVPDSHRASWSNNIYVDSRQRIYYLELFIPAALLSVDWLNPICDQIEQKLAQVTFTEVNPTLRIRIANVGSAATA